MNRPTGFTTSSLDLSSGLLMSKPDQERLVEAINKYLEQLKTETISVGLLGSQMLMPVHTQSRSSMVIPEPTVESIKAAVAALSGGPPNTSWGAEEYDQHVDRCNRPSLFGMKVVENPYITAKPRMVLAENVPVTEEFRAEINQWMIEFFGMEPERIFFVGHDTVIMSPKAAALIKVTT